MIVHEYVHGVFEFLGSNHGGSSSYEHSLCDAIPAILRDRFNANQHRRTETFLVSRVRKAVESLAGQSAIQQFCALTALAAGV